MKRFRLTAWHWVVLGLLAVVVICTPFGALAWQGYLFPLRYYERFPNGRVSVEGYKLRHSRHIWLKEGKWTSYANDKDDSKFKEGFYHNGVAVGTWTEWNPDGSVKAVEERDKLGTKTRTEYQGGIPKVVWDRDKAPRHFWSPNVYDDDRAKDEEIHTAIDLKVQHGATPEEAEASAVREFKLHKEGARQPSSPPSGTASGR